MSRLAITISFLIPLLTLSFISALILNSVSPLSFRQQVIYILIGLALFFIISKVDYLLYLFSPWPWYVITVLLLLATLIFGYTTRGSTRWIMIMGQTFQSSEFIKPLMVIFLSSLLTQKSYPTLLSVIKLLLVFSLPFFLIMRQPDLGSAIIIAITCLVALIASGISLKHLLILILIIATIIPIGYSQLMPYQKARIISFINPQSDPLGTGYNALQATIAVGSGKLFGRGLGQGTQSHLRFLPEKHSDFIFAAITEELGFVGGAILISAYLFLSLVLVRAAKNSSSDTGSLICLISLGLTLSQAAINIGMNMGLLPITGVTLPFVSSGGSSVVSFFTMMGICYSVALRTSRKLVHLEIH